MLGNKAVKLALIFLQHAASQTLTGLVPRENLYGLPDGNWLILARGLAGFLIGKFHLPLEPVQTSLSLRSADPVKSMG